MTTDNSSELSSSNDTEIVMDLIRHQQRYTNGHRIWRIPHQICVWDKEGMLACSGLEGVVLPAITRFKHISKLSIFAEEGEVNGNGTATNKKLTP